MSDKTAEVQVMKCGGMFLVYMTVFGVICSWMSRTFPPHSFHYKWIYDMLGLLGFAYWMQKLNKAWDKEALLYVCTHMFV